MDRLREYTKPKGYGPLQEWVGVLAPLNVAFSKNDMPAATKLFRGSVSVLRALAPHLNGHNLQATVLNIVDECRELVNKLKNGGSLKNITAFLQLVSGQMNLALDAKSHK